MNLYFENLPEATRHAEAYDLGLWRTTSPLGAFWAGIPTPEMLMDDSGRYEGWEQLRSFKIGRDWREG